MALLGLTAQSATSNRPISLSLRPSETPSDSRTSTRTLTRISQSLHISCGVANQGRAYDKHKLPEVSVVMWLPGDVSLVTVVCSRFGSWRRSLEMQGSDERISMSLV